MKSAKYQNKLKWQKNTGAENQNNGTLEMK